MSDGARSIERRYGPPGLTLGAPTRRSDAAIRSLGRLSGYAAVFNSLSHPVSVRGQTVLERISPGAFDKTLRGRPDVLALIGHDDGRPIARTPQTLRLSVDSKGLRVSIDILDTTDGRDLAEQVRSGVIRGMSFGFRVIREAMVPPEVPGDISIRRLDEIELYEVSAVTSPAYGATSISTDPVGTSKGIDDDYFMERFG